MSSAICIDLDQSKILSPGNGLGNIQNLLTIDKRKCVNQQRLSFRSLKMKTSRRKQLFGKKVTSSYWRLNPFPNDKF